LSISGSQNQEPIDVLSSPNQEIEKHNVRNEEVKAPIFEESIPQDIDQYLLSSYPPQRLPAKVKEKINRDLTPT